MNQVPEWFRKLVDYLPEEEQWACYQEYRNYRDEGHSQEYCLVTLGYKDPAY